MKKTTDIIFMLLLVIILLGGMLKPILKPLIINNYENREAVQIPKFELLEISNKNFQNNFEKALADQIPFASRMKLIEKTIELGIKVEYSKINKTIYNRMGHGIYLLDGYLVYYPYSLEKSQKEILLKSQNINSILSDNDDINYYLYYIEKDTDINFENNEHAKVYETLNQLLIDKIKTDKFTINNINEYEEYFYKTDHHWNYKGSYKGYKEILKLMDINDSLLNKSELCLKQKLSGSKAREIGGQLFFKEKFCAYTFELPEHNIRINNQKVESYGDYKKIINSEINEVSYGNFYGGDYGLLEFDYNQPEKENLLIIGESYDNAINEILASHFNKTYNVDLRAYEKDIGEKFNLKKFVNKYNIDNVLLIGNIDFYLSDTFMLS